VKQMCLYDALQHNKESIPSPLVEKENKSPKKKPIFSTEQPQKTPIKIKPKTPEKKTPRSTTIKNKTSDPDTASETDTYTRLYLQSKDITTRK
jgi:hypothetical protein